MTSSHIAGNHAPSLALLGGKGANLVRLRDAGFPVPEFVVLGTEEYRVFVAEHGLDAEIPAALAEAADVDDASRRIRAAFRRPLSEEQRIRMLAAIGRLLDGPVAVRSSATAEDLPDASFAGQQDTFLNVRGTQEVLAAVVECWSSLWTERAIAYRANHGLDQSALSLAVVVQEMVPAEASGVLFTADPLSGRRDRVVIDAVGGLGEQLVSGQVTPDHFEVDSAGSVTHPVASAGRSPLTTGQVRELAVLGRRIEAAMGAPQDIEWTRVGDRLQVVQSRAITSLFPLPEGPAEALWFSFGAFQGMVEPITPLGQDTLRALVSGAGRLFGGSGDFRTNPYLKPAAGRLWLRLDEVLRTGIGSRLVPSFLAAADPNGAAVVRGLGAELGSPSGPSSTLPALRRVLPFAGRVVPRLVLALRRPAEARLLIDAGAQALLGDHAARLSAAEQLATPEDRLKARIAALDEFGAAALPTLLPLFAPVMALGGGGMVRLRALARASALADPDRRAMGALRALPGNVTTEMDLALWQVAVGIREDPESARVFAAEEAASLAEHYLAGTLPAQAQDALAGFLERFGMRGVGEIDLGVPRWREDPTGVVRSLLSYLTLGPADAPDAAYARARAEAADDLAAIIAVTSPLARLQVRFLVSRVRDLFGARETPKFVLVQGLGLLRDAFLASGRDLVGRGVLTAERDVFLLHRDELAGAWETPGLTGLVEERRELLARERRRGRVPVALAGDGRAFFEGGGQEDADLSGMGVSPGVVEGAARVLFHPGDADLAPGEILVCRGTDPAWTPLFLTAGGLITEVGGLMTHGSVVAREYGLPAVVGVVGATERITSGQRLRVDGTTGAITLLDS